MIRGHSSFWVHLPCAGLVAIAGMLWNLAAWEWAVVGLCVIVVLVAELFNTAMEELAKAVDPAFNPQIRDALDVASAAVLVAAFAVALVRWCSCTCAGLVPRVLFLRTCNARYWA